MNSTSPILVYAILYDMDCELEEVCNKKNCIYSRYVDDISISSFYKKDILSNQLITIDHQNSFDNHSKKKNLIFYFKKTPLLFHLSIPKTT